MSLNTETTTGENIAVSFICGETGLPYRVIFRRNHSAYLLSAVERLSPFPNDPQHECESSTEVDINALPTGQISCPWCQSSKGIWRCGRCHTLSCGSAEKKLDGGKLEFQCRQCEFKTDVTNGAGGSISNISVGDNPTVGSMGSNAGRLLTYSGS